MSQQNSRVPDAGKQPSSVLTPKLVLNALRQWWKIAMPLGLILGAVGCVVVFLWYKPMYKSHVLLWIDDSKPYVLSPEREDRNFVKNQQGLIRSSLVLGPVVSTSEIADLSELSGKDDPIAALAKMIRVVPSPGTELFELTCTSESAENAQLIANAVAASYFRLADEFEAGRAARLIELLEQAKLDKEDRVERLKDNVRILSKQQGGPTWAGDTGLDDKAVLNPLINLQNSLNSARVEQEVLKSQIKAFEEYLESSPIVVSDDEVSALVARDEQVRELQRSISLRQAEALETKAKSARGEKDPSYLRLQQSIQDDERLLADTQAELRTSIKQEAEANHLRDREDALAKMKEDLSALYVRERILQEALTQQTSKLKQSRVENLELEFKKDELSREKTLLDAIATRLHLLRTEQRAPFRIELKEAAKLPSSPEESLPMKKLLVAGGIGFGLPFVLALLWELYVQRVTDTQQLEERGKIIVVGEIAHANRFRTHRGRASKALRLFEESVDHLRTHLVLSQPVEDLHVVAVLSAASGEGKTTVAAQLAVSLARASGQRVLLIDCDMRSPDVHGLFDVELEPGLAQVLNHETELEQAIVPSWLEGLYILPAGRLAANPHKLLGNGAWQALLDTSRQTYRYVVIDTPPVLPAGESLVLARSADAAILCVRRDVSRVQQVNRSYDRLNSAGANVIGCVMNGVPRRRYEHSYGYYYGQ